MGAYRSNLSKKVRPNFKKLLVHECDALTNFDLYSCVGTLDAVKKITGSASIQLVKNADAVGYFVCTITKAVNIYKYRNITFSFYTANKSNLSSIGLVLFTSVPFDYGSCFIKFIGSSSISNGWNTFSVSLIESDFAKYGTNGMELVEGIRFTINIDTDNATETVNFDSIFLNKKVFMKV